MISPGFTSRWVGAAPSRSEPKLSAYGWSMGCAFVRFAQKGDRNMNRTIVVAFAALARGTPRSDRRATRYQPQQERADTSIHRPTIKT